MASLTQQPIQQRQRDFNLLLIEKDPYSILNVLGAVPVIKTNVCRDPARARHELQQGRFDAVLIRVDDQSRQYITGLRAESDTAPIIGLVDDAREPLALKMLGLELDDYLLSESLLPATAQVSNAVLERHAERIVHACRQARRLRAAQTLNESQSRILQQLRRKSQETSLGLDILASMLRSDASSRNSPPAQDALERKEEQRLIDSLRESNAPIRQACSARELIEVAKQLAVAGGLSIEPEVRIETDREVYCDLIQVAEALAMFIRRAENDGAQNIQICAEPSRRHRIQISLRDDGTPIDSDAVAAQLGRFPLRRQWDGDQQRARQLLRLSLAKQQLQNNLGRLQISADQSGSQIEFELPLNSATSVFSCMFERLKATAGPDVQLTLLQVRTPADSPQAATLLQSLVRPHETAFPTSDSNWIVAITAEAAQIDARMHAIWRDWNQDCPQSLIMRAVGRWPLAEKQEELLGHIQTLADLGDLSLETHPKLLLVRPQSSKPTSLDRRLQAAGFDVIAAAEDGLSDVMSACSPDAVVVACEDGVHSLNANIAETMDSIAKIPIILMSASARHLQHSLQIGMDHSLPAASHESRESGSTNQSSNGGPKLPFQPAPQANKAPTVAPRDDRPEKGVS